MKKLFLGMIVFFGAVSAVNAAEPLSGNATKADQQLCESAWSQSSAKQTCPYSDVYYMGGDNCNVAARCEAWNGDHNYLVNTAITTTLYNTRNLHNCDGHLKVGGC